MSTTKFWAYIQGQVLGPFDARQLLLTPGFSPDILVCPEGAHGDQLGDWQRADARSEITELLRGQTSIPAVTLPSPLPTAKQVFSSPPPTEKQAPSPMPSEDDKKRLAEQVRNLERSLTSLEKELEVKNKALQNAQQQINDLEQRLNQRETPDPQATFKERDNKEIAELRANLAQAQTNAMDLEKRLSHVTQELEHERRRADHMSGEREELVSSYQTMPQELADARSQLQAEQQRASHLETRLFQLERDLSEKSAQFEAVAQNKTAKQSSPRTAHVQEAGGRWFLGLWSLVFTIATAFLAVKAGYLSIPHNSRLQKIPFIRKLQPPKGRATKRAQEPMKTNASAGLNRSQEAISLVLSYRQLNARPGKTVGEAFKEKFPESVQWNATQVYEDVYLVRGIALNALVYYFEVNFARKEVMGIHPEARQMLQGESFEAQKPVSPSPPIAAKAASPPAKAAKPKPKAQKPIVKSVPAPSEDQKRAEAPKQPAEPSVSQPSSQTSASETKPKKKEAPEVGPIEDDIEFVLPGIPKRN